MSTSPYPPQGYCINLDRRPDRWKQFVDHKNNPASCKFFDNIQRLSAVDGRRFHPKLSKTNAGALGCTLSHIRALTLLQKLARHPHEIMMVVEDDVLVLDPAQLQRVVQGWDRLAMARDWHVVTFTASGPIQTLRRKTDDDLGLLHVVNAHSTTGYLIRRYSIPYLLQVFTHSALQLQQGASRRQFALDVAWLRLQRKIPFLTFGSMVMTQRIGVSDIEQRVTDYSSLFVRSLTNTLGRKLLLTYPRSGSHLVRFFIEMLSGNATYGYPNNIIDVPSYKAIYPEPLEFDICCTDPDQCYHRYHKPLDVQLLMPHPPCALIVVVRNPREVIPRHLGFELHGLKSDSPINSSAMLYFDILTYYYSFKGTKILFYYEDIITNRKKFIHQLWSFLGQTEHSRLDRVLAQLDHLWNMSHRASVPGRPPFNNSNSATSYYYPQLTPEPRAVLDKYIEKHLGQFPEIAAKYDIRCK